MDKVDLLLLGGTVITMNASYDVFAPGAVAIQGNHIVAVGPQEDLQARFEATESWDCHDQVIIPGLINTHTHMPMSLLRGLADDLRLDVWLYGYILPVEKQFVNPEFCYLGTLLSCAEMIRGGVDLLCRHVLFRGRGGLGHGGGGDARRLRRDGDEVPHARRRRAMTKAWPIAASFWSIGAATS